MDFERIIRDVEAMHLHLYSLALYTPQGLRHHRFLPGSNCSNSYSVAKAFVMTALGMLQDDGRIRMTDPICRYLDLPQDADPRWKQATVEHALTHTLGFDEGFLDIDVEDAAQYPTDDYLELVFAHPLAHTPGEHRQYSDAAFYLLSRLFSRAAGENLDSFLNRRLIRPLGFREIAWSRCPLEYPIGATGLYIGAQDMVKLGALYMEGGMWQGRRLLSREWTETAVAREYAFHTLCRDMPDAPAGKGGMYGQMLLFSTAHRFAAAWHGHEEGEDYDRLIDYFCTLR